MNIRRYVRINGSDVHWRWSAPEFWAEIQRRCDALDRYDEAKAKRVADKQAASAG